MSALERWLAQHCPDRDLRTLVHDYLLARQACCAQQSLAVQLGELAGRLDCAAERGGWRDGNPSGWTHAISHATLLAELRRLQALAEHGA
ncbi:hypothetical protein [Chitinilyticum litopenaei]|uniref:hypothetical protein n=1 Tax=Chitinilyticum litopenaei TaxID=1121276 RepID=UPI0004920F7F|nr:hypothetical protein [Chitinilyticum litopenaei]